MKKTRFTKVLALTLVILMVMSSVPASAYTVLSNKLTATVNVVPVTLDPLAILNALNITQVEKDTEFAMQAALENPDLGLNLSKYNMLTTGGRRQAVADYVSFTKFAKGNFASVGDVQNALDTGVQIETNKMHLIQLLNNYNERTLAEIVLAIRDDNVRLLNSFDVDDINSFYQSYGVDTINKQNAILKSFIDLSDEQKAEATSLFMANTYSGSYVTVLNYLKAAVDEAVIAPAITLTWESGGDINGDNLTIGSAEVGSTKQISFTATTNKDVTNVGYIVSSDKYITINNITGLTHYIDSSNLTTASSETINIEVKFESVGDCTLTVEAVKQDDTTPAEITNTSAHVSNNDGSPRISLGFELDEEIDLTQTKLGNIIISYGTYIDGSFVETLREDGTPIVKSKLWDGYLNLGDTTTKYCSGAKNGSYGNIVPNAEVIKTVVDPNYLTMKYADDAAWIEAILNGNVAVKVIVIDNEGNQSQKIIVAK